MGFSNNWNYGNLNSRLTLFLLQAFFQSFFPPGVSAQTAVLNPVKVGVDVTLLVNTTVSGTIVTFSWYRGTEVNDPDRILTFTLFPNPTQDNGTQFTGREEPLNDGSLRIRNVSTRDSGSYTISITTNPGGTKTGTTLLQVYEVLQNTTISFNNSSPVTENGTVVMTYGGKGTVDKILWYKDNKLLPASVNKRSVSDGDRIQLSSDNETLTISNVSRTDSGIYQCEASNPVSTSRSDEITLEVSFGPDTPTIILTSNPVLVGSKVTLNCTAASSPAPKYEWLVNQTEKGTEQLLVIESVSFSDAGTYTCWASNSITNLRSMKQIELQVTEASLGDPSGGLTGGQIAGIVIGVILGVILIAVCVFFLVKAKSTNGLKSDPHPLADIKSSASNDSK
ncbi:carcinoembryonic antigen-related cell adhesion molecule 1-like [Latimeria chalumnae]|uniref:carcinoembryonic antigen-related cell adhesion molecule 1-like n=1 Tax=Latimeria chalumnae TaxID=7897 RepID=UPI00313E672E